MDENQNRTPSGAAADENTEQLAQKLYQTMEQTLRAARESEAEQPAQKQTDAAPSGAQGAAQSPAAQQDAEDFEVLQAVSVHREAQHNDATDRIPVRQKPAAKESEKPQKKKKEKAAASRKTKHPEKAEKAKEAHPMAKKQREQGTEHDAANRRGTAVRDASRYFQSTEQTPPAPPSGGKKGGKPKKKGRGLTALIIVLVLVLGIGAGAAAVVHHFKNYTPDVAPLPGPGEEQSSDAGSDADGEQIKIPEREQQVYNILITGIDKESHSSDVIMVVRFNAKDEAADKGSVLNYYKKMIRLRKSAEYTEALSTGSIQPILLDYPDIIAYTREGGRKAAVICSFSPYPLAVKCGFPVNKALISNYPEVPAQENGSVTLPPFFAGVFDITEE